MKSVIVLDLALAVDMTTATCKLTFTTSLVSVSSPNFSETTTYFRRGFITQSVEHRTGIGSNRFESRWRLRIFSGLYL